MITPAPGSDAGVVSKAQRGSPYRVVPGSVCIGPIRRAMPFFGGVVTNIVGMVADLGKNGLVGLIAVAIIAWLFSKRTLA